MSDRYRILLLFALTLALYLPSVRSGYFVVDDLLLVKNIKEAGDQSFFAFFKPDNGTYYRPLMALSYNLDEWLWEMKPAAMHMVNILIHAMNAALVFLLARRMTTIKSVSSLSLPFLAALLFIVHPANTESINWISGRSDPLATLFILLAVYIFIHGLQHLGRWQLWLAAALTLAGCLVKEIAFFIFPGFILTLLLMKTTKTGILRSEPGISWRTSACWPFVAGGLLYGYMRSAAVTRIDLGTGMILENVATESLIWSKIGTMMAALGFYLKKLVVPWPLDFAIGQIAPLYFWVGLVAAVIILFCTLKRDRYSAILLFTLLPLAPALLVPVVKFAFMPAYAERYLYLSTAFFSIGLAVLPRVPRKNGKTALALLLVLVIVYLPVTIQRNLAWADQLEVLESAGVQTLEHPHFWNAYCVALADRKHYDKARGEFNTLISQHPEDQYAYRNLALMEEYINDPESARQVLEPFFREDMVPEKETLSVMVRINQSRLAANQDPEQHKVIHDELISSRLKLFDLTKEPDFLLAAADSAREIDEFDLAGELLDRMIALKSDNPEISNEIRRIRGMIDDRP